MNKQADNWDLNTIGAQLVAMQAQLDRIEERQRKAHEVFEEFSPIMRDVMIRATKELADLEERGYFMFARKMADIVDRVVTSYDEDDLTQFSDSVVTIIDTMRNVTQPDVLALANEATNAIHDAEGVKGKGLYGMLRASNDKDVKKGMAVALEVLRHVGRAATRMDPSNSKRNRLASMLASRNARPALPGPDTLSSRVAPRRATPPRPPAQAMAPTTPPTQQAVIPNIPGVDFDNEGFMTDPSQWSRDVATQMASAFGLPELSEDHWKLFEYARSQFESTGKSPNIRALTLGSGISTKQIYQMFPLAPGIYTARLSGLPKPAGCI